MAVVFSHTITKRKAEIFTFKYQYSKKQRKNASTKMKTNSCIFAQGSEMVIYE